jgi:hypothetical protein
MYVRMAVFVGDDAAIHWGAIEERQERAATARGTAEAIDAGSPTATDPLKAGLAYASLMVGAIDAGTLGAVGQHAIPDPYAPTIRGGWRRCWRPPTTPRGR